MTSPCFCGSPAWLTSPSSAWLDTSNWSIMWDIMKWLDMNIYLHIHMYLYVNIKQSFQRCHFKVWQHKAIIDFLHIPDVRVQICSACLLLAIANSGSSGPSSQIIQLLLSPVQALHLTLLGWFFKSIVLLASCALLLWLRSRSTVLSSCRCNFHLMGDILQVPHSTSP